MMPNRRRSEEVKRKHAVVYVEEKNKMMTWIAPMCRLRQSGIGFTAKRGYDPNLVVRVS